MMHTTWPDKNVLNKFVNENIMALIKSTYPQLRWQPYRVMSDKLMVICFWLLTCVRGAAGGLRLTSQDQLFRQREVPFGHRRVR